MSELSPAAKAVLEAVWNAPDGRDSYRLAAAAALRAAVEQAIPEADAPDDEEWLGQSAWIQAEQAARHRLLKIATELENAS